MENTRTVRGAIARVGSTAAAARNPADGVTARTRAAGVIARIRAGAVLKPDTLARNVAEPLQTQDTIKVRTAVTRPTTGAAAVPRPPRATRRAALRPKEAWCRTREVRHRRPAVGRRPAVNGPPIGKASGPHQSGKNHVIIPRRERRRRRRRKRTRTRTKSGMNPDPPRRGKSGDLLPPGRRSGAPRSSSRRATRTRTSSKTPPSSQR